MTQKPSPNTSSSNAAPGYRDSHLGKGQDYHAKFTSNARRNLLWSVEKRFLNDIIKRWTDPKITRHLDFACGTGRILHFLSERVKTSTGVDVSASMLEQARMLSPTARFIHGDVTHSDLLPEETFDLITAFRFFPNAESALRLDAARALHPKLSPNGIFVFNNHRNNGCLAFRTARLLRRGAKSFSGMTFAETNEFLDSAGFQVEKIYSVGIVPEFETRLLRPRFLINAIEHTASFLPLSPLHEDLVYVCSKRGI